MREAGWGKCVLMLQGIKGNVLAFPCTDLLCCFFLLWVRSSSAEWCRKLPHGPFWPLPEVFCLPHTRFTGQEVAEFPLLPQSLPFLTAIMFGCSLNHIAHHLSFFCMGVRCVEQDYISHQKTHSCQKTSRKGLLAIADIFHWDDTIAFKISWCEKKKSSAYNTIVITLFSMVNGSTTPSLHRAKTIILIRLHIINRQMGWPEWKWFD